MQLSTVYAVLYRNRDCRKWVMLMSTVALGNVSNGDVICNV